MTARAHRARLQSPIQDFGFEMQHSSNFKISLKLVPHADLDLTRILGTGELTEIRRRHHTRRRAVVCSVERIGHVCIDVQIFARSIAFPINVGRCTEEKRLGDIEIEVESLRTFGAISGKPRRTVVDDAVPVVIFAGSNVVPVWASQGCRAGQKASQSKPRIHRAVDVMCRTACAVGAYIVGTQVVTVTGEGFAVGIGFGKSPLYLVSGRNVKDAESLPQIQPEGVLELVRTGL